MNEFAKDYFDFKPELYEEILRLARDQNVKVFDKLREDTNEINFFSWLSEMKFGIKLGQFAEKLFYEPQVDGYEPDWLVEYDGQIMIFEVLRRNPIETAMQNKIDEYKNSRANTSEASRLTVISGCWDSKYFYNTESSIFKKEKKYRPFITKTKYPFIICADISNSDIPIFADEIESFFLNEYNGYFYLDSEFKSNIAGFWAIPYFLPYCFVQNQNAAYKCSERAIDVLKRV